VARDITRTKTVERVLTREEIARALPLAELTQEEELVLRLKYGIGLGADEQLTFVARGNEELDARLALIEKAILDLLEEGDAAPGRSVLDRFKDL
jgi:DNA-directed RNA polymerase sigma subunit (sigma70/sigma32)